MADKDMTLTQYLRRLYLDSQNGEGQVELGKVEEEAVSYVREHPELLEVRKTIHNRLKSLDDSMRPKFENFGQATFLEEIEATFIPTGPSLRVRTDMASLPEWDAWWLIQTQEHGGHVKAYQSKFDAYVGLRRAWKTQHQTVGDVLRDMNGG